MKIIAFFDFDGTITKKDSFIDFIQFTCGYKKTLIGFIIFLPILILYKIKIIPNYKTKEMILEYFFKDLKENEFKKYAYNYSLRCIDKIIKKNAMKKIIWHKKCKHEIIIVSASIECWLKPWCNKNNIKLIATKLEIKNGLITGKLLTKNCYGQEKVNRIKNVFNLNNYDVIYAYGDSLGDKEMLNLANKKFYKIF